MKRDKTPEWTIARVKAELPYVQVVYRKERWTGKLSGRLNDDATVTIGYCDAERWKVGKSAFAPFYLDAHFSWQTVANVLNNRAGALVF